MRCNRWPEKDFPFPHLSGIKDMSKEQKSNKENKKKPVLTQKEKKAAKKSRKESRGLFNL
jgi:hypothetical protein